MKKRIGIRQIAAMANVSIGPVDKVINNRGGVSEKTRQRILQVIEELGYKRNLLASRLKSSKEYKIAILIPEATSDISFWSQYAVGFDKIYSELHHFGLNLETYNFKQTDEKSFKNQIDVIIRKKYDGIFMVPIFADETLRLINKCRKSNTPEIFFDTDQPGLEKLSYIGQHSADSGFAAADLMSKCLSPKSKILVLAIVRKEDNHFHFAEREKGFRRYFENTSHQIVKYQNKDWDQKKLREEILNVFNAHRDIEGIFVTNGIDKVAAIIAHIKRGNQVLLGYDLIADNIEYLKKGVIDFLISQKPEKQAYQGIMLFHEHLILKQQVQSSYYLPIDIVIRSNLDYYQ